MSTMSNNSKSLKQCRICLHSDMEEYMSVFETYKEIPINDYILLITNVEIKQGDGLPDRICSSCFLELETALNFKQKCENSDVLLKENKGSIIEVCTETIDTDIQKLLIVKKEEPIDIDIKLEDAADGIDSLEECYSVEALEEISVDNIKPFKSKAIDLKLECHDCGNLFKSKCKLRVHWKKTHMLTALICDICKRRFKSYKAYHRHKKNKLKSCHTAASDLVKVEGEGRNRMFHCKECPYKTKRAKDIRAHIVIHNGDKPYHCTMCSSKYTQQSSLQSHMEYAHKKYLVEITCHYCGKQLKGRTKVYRHMRSHTEAKYPCTVCQKPISKKNFKQHVQRHSGVKSYTCEKCASTFYTLSELCNHRRWVHNDKKKPFKCDLCDYSASRKERITMHRKNHTDTNIACAVCGMFFTSAPKLEVHQKRHFAEKKFECSYCDMKFYRRDSVSKHIKSKHKCILPVTKERPVTFKVEPVETGDVVVVKISKKE